MPPCVQFFVARGAKELTLYPPSQSRHLYAAPQRLGELCEYETMALPVLGVRPCCGSSCQAHADVTVTSSQWNGFLNSSTQKDCFPTCRYALLFRAHGCLRRRGARGGGLAAAAAGVGCGSDRPSRLHAVPALLLVAPRARQPRLQCLLQLLVRLAMRMPGCTSFLAASPHACSLTTCAYCVDDCSCVTQVCAIAKEGGRANIPRTSENRD